jgi:hypothetical protein
MDPENRRYFAAAGCEGMGGAANGALAESKAVASHRTPKKKRVLECSGLRQKNQAETVYWILFGDTGGEHAIQPRQGAF